MFAILLFHFFKNIFYKLFNIKIINVNKYTLTVGLKGIKNTDWIRLRVMDLLLFSTPSRHLNSR